MLMFYEVLGSLKVRPSATNEREYIGILTNGMREPLWYATVHDIPAGYKLPHWQVKTMEVCTGGRIVFYLSDIRERS